MKTGHKNRRSIYWKKLINIKLLKEISIKMILKLNIKRVLFNSLNIV